MWVNELDEGMRMLGNRPVVLPESYMVSSIDGGLHASHERARASSYDEGMKYLPDM